jgi:hypothetical protein
MQSRWILISVFIFSAGGIPTAAENKPRQHSLEQLHFSAEDPGVKVPVTVPEEVLATLRKEKTVQGALEDRDIRSENLPPSWFSASEIHLGAANRTDLVVVGEPPVSGGNVAIFWVFCATANGYQLALTAPAHDLAVKNARWKGHRNIELTSLSAVQISTVLLRFDGKRYTEYRSKSEPIR